MTPPAAFLSDVIRQQIVDHCISELPNEACGLLAVDDGRVVEVYPTRNSDGSPNSYTIPPQEHFDALMKAESRGWEIGGVFHSHPNGSATMSTVDLAKALDPTWLYVVVGLGGAEPVVTVNRVS